MPLSKWAFAGILVAGTLANILLSPKWAMPIFAWVAPGCMLFYFRYATLRRKMLWFIVALVTSQFVSSVNVFPFPLPVTAVLIIINTLKLLAIFLTDRWITRKSNGFFSTLVFPAAYVTKEFIDGYFGGSWWSIANTQYSFLWLAQLSSVTGLAGISFMVYWFAAVACRCVYGYYNHIKVSKPIAWYATVLVVVLIFGAYRFYNDTASGTRKVEIAGVTVPNIGLMQAIYKDVTGKDITVDLKTSIVSKQLQQVNTAMIPFIENPDTAKFVNGYKALHSLDDSLFAESKQAADNGAKVIVWSEANAIMPRTMQNAFIERGVDFARDNRVYLLMAMGVFDTGKITATKMFLENKAILIAPGGAILNVFHKNHPVPYAERSTPGDGKVPVIATPYGNMALSICYDADMPASMRQAGSQKADMLLLPSGDWYAIDPYHTYMAAFRGIENGCTVVRQASGGLSLVTDYRGRQQASFDFFEPGKKLWQANIITGHVHTIYTTIGDAFAYCCMLFTGLTIIYIISGLFITGKKKEEAALPKGQVMVY